MEPSSQLEIEVLLGENDPWLRRLARRLVGVDRADDVMQEARMAALGQSGRPSRGWWARVVRNLAAREHRSVLRRRGREQRAARSIAQDPVSERHLDRLEVRRRVAEAVLALPEPARTTIVLRFFEGIGPSEIGERMGVSVRTVESRLRRSLRYLRNRLSRESDDPKAWMASLAAIVHASPVPAVPLIPTAPAMVASVTGGIVMMNKAILSGVVVLSVLLALVIATVIDRPEETLGRSQKPSSVASSRQSSDQSEVQLAQDVGKRSETLSGSSPLLPSLGGDSRATVSAEPGHESDPAGTSDVATEEEEEWSGLWIVFGSYEDVPELAGADWPGLGASVLSVVDLLIDGAMREKAGDPPDEDAFGQLTAEIRKTAKLASTIKGKVPTTLPGHGELFHPIVVANLIAYALAEGGLPLRDVQVKRLVQAGTRYELNWRRRQKTMESERVLLKRLLIELEIKSEFGRSVRQCLDSDQERILFDAITRGRSGLDPLSPRSVLSGLIHPVVVEERRDVAEPFLGVIDRAIEGSRSDWDPKGFFAKLYRRETGPMLAKRRNFDQQYTKLEVVERVARAQATVLSNILRRSRLSEPQLARLAAIREIYLPVLRDR